MNWLVEELLNFDFNKKDREKMMSYLSFITFGKLSQTYNVPKGSYMEFLDRDSSSGLRAAACEESKSILVAKDFMTKPENYGKDICTLFHESRHIAQYSGKKGDKQKPTKLQLSWMNNDALVDMMIVESMGNGHEDLGSLWAYDHMVVAMMMSTYKEYFFAKYFLSPCEMDARAYGRNMLEHIIADVDKSKLTGRAKKNYDNFVKAIAEDKERENNLQQKNNAKLREDRGETEKLVRKAQKSNVSRLDMCTSIPADATEDRANRVIRSMGFDVISAMYESLAFYYDEKCAQKLYKTCLNMKYNEGKYLKLACDVMRYTEYKPNEADFKVFKDKCTAFNKKCKEDSEKINYKKLLSTVAVNQSQESIETSINQL
jgi:hypothetical protein